MRGTRHSNGALPALLAIPLLAALGACGGRTGLPPDDTLVVALESGPLRLDPRIGTDQASWRVHDVVFPGLVKKGLAGEFVPDLAESVESVDGSVWTARLRKGLTFHDGRSLTSRDVAFTYRSLLSGEFASSKREPLKIIESVETPDDLTVVFRLQEPYGSFPLQLLLGIVPDGTTPEALEARPVGAGPYRFLSYKTDDRVVFERFDGWYGGRAKISRLVFRIVPDATTRALELLRGSVHLSVNNTPPDLLPRFRETPGVAVTVRPGSTYAYLAFNLRDPVLRKVEVRRALALALDRDALASGLWRGTVKKTETLLPEGHWARANDLPVLTPDLDEARRLLDAAGFPVPGDGRPRLSLTYKTSTDETSILQATAIAEQWKRVGVETSIRSNDFATFYQDVVKGNFRLFSLRWQGIVDPDHYHEVFLSTSVPPKGWNRGYYTDPEVDRWILDARRLLDRGQRKALYRELQLRAARDLPYISLYTTMSIAVHDSRLTGVEAMNPTADFSFLPGLARR